MRVLGALIVLVVLASACRRAEPDRTTEVEEELEIEDVAPSIDAGLSTDQDVKGPPMVSGISGVLPSDYPRDLPTHEPASIVDFGSTADSWSFVELDTPSPRSAVSDGLGKRLTSAGWSVGGRDSSSLHASKAGVSVRISFVDLDPGTRIRVEYR